MNSKGRPWKINPLDLEPRIFNMRVIEKLGHKQIAAALGYSHDRIRKLCWRFGITKKGYNNKRIVDPKQEAVENMSGAVPPQET